MADNWSAVVSADAEETLQACRSFLATDPIRHNVIWTLLERHRVEGASGRYAWVSREGEVVGVLLQSRPVMPATISPMELAAVQVLAGALRNVSVELPGVTGQAESATRFADEWSAQAQVAAQSFATERLYSATKVTKPDVERGEARWATDDDAALLAKWLWASHVETHERGSDPAAMVDGAIAARQYLVWDVDGPVSMAACTTPVGGVTRVRGVYTPPGHRSNGFAAACVAELSEYALAAGDMPMLYTDAENLVSNAVYRRIGYCVVDEVVSYDFV